MRSANRRQETTHITLSTKGVLFLEVINEITPDPSLFPVFLSSTSTSTFSESTLLPAMTVFLLARPLWGLLLQSAGGKKSSDIKYNGGRKSRKSYRAGMNSFPFDLVPFSFNLLLSASSWPESSLCVSALRRRVGVCSTLTPCVWAKHMFCSAGSPVNPPHPRVRTCVSVNRGVLKLPSLR